MLYRRGGERTVACITHSRGDLSWHYMIPALLEAGYAVCGFTHRAFINDFAVVHEVKCLDIAGALRDLKADRGFEQVVLLANSGGRHLRPADLGRGRRERLTPMRRPLAYAT